MSRPRTQSGVRPERVIACTAVMAIHFVVAWVLVSSTERAPAPASTDLQVVFIQPAKQHARSVERKPPHSVTPRPAASHEVDSTPTPHQQGAEARPVVTTIVHQAPIPVVANDEWEPSTSKPTDDGIAFSRNVLASSYNPRPRPAPGRFRMKREITPEDIVRGASQILGFWPPGYTDDPCGGLKKTVEIFMEHRTPRTDAQLADALLQRDMYCQ